MSMTDLGNRYPDRRTGRLGPPLGWTGQVLRDLLDTMSDREAPLVVPGVFDALSARIAEGAGFEAAYLSGAYTSMTAIGRPDVELLGGDEMARHAGNVADSLGIPLLADADTGFGNAMNVRRTVRAYLKAGVAGCQIEDQVSPKRCGHLPGKELISADDFVRKISAAVDEKDDRAFTIVARSDARDVEGLEGLIERSKRYAEAGADLFFPEAVKSVEEVAEIHQACGLPILVNQVPNGNAPVLPNRDLFDAGCVLVIYPALLISAAIRAMEEAAQTFDGDSGLDLLGPAQSFSRVGYEAWLDISNTYSD